MNRVEGDRAGSDAHARSWHVAPKAVPRDTVSTPSLSVPTSTAFAKACASLRHAPHLASGGHALCLGCAPCCICG
eukprot:2190122-Pleurochrysis_carterae.AAC.1